jgi:hypothetical protein
MLPVVNKPYPRPSRRVVHAKSYAKLTLVLWPHCWVGEYCAREAAMESRGNKGCWVRYRSSIQRVLAGVGVPRPSPSRLISTRPSPHPVYMIPQISLLFLQFSAFFFSCFQLGLNGLSLLHIWYPLFTFFALRTVGLSKHDVGAGSRPMAEIGTGSFNFRRSRL